MSLTVAQARDDVMRMLKSAIDASAHSGVNIIWSDTRSSGPGNAVSAGSNPPPHLTVSMVHYSGRQTSMGPVARFERRGTLRVEIRCPAGTGMSLSDELSQLVLNTYEGHSSQGGVWFRNCRLQDADPDGNFSRVDVLADFTYTQVK